MLDIKNWYSNVSTSLSTNVLLKMIYNMSYFDFSVKHIKDLILLL